MKKTLLSLFIICACSLIVAAQSKNDAKPKLSPLTKQYLDKIKKTGDINKPLPNYVYKQSNNKLYISSLIKVNDVNQSDLDALGVKIGTKAGNIWTAQIPVENVQAFTNVAGISYIQLDEPVFPLLDSARRVTHVDSVTSGINLPMPINGKGVITGIIDAGFDYRHPTLFDTTYGSYRVKRVWAEKSQGTPPSGFIYGNELTDSSAIIAAASDTNILSHGTHVAGIAAGSGYGSNTNEKRFRGMAFESDIVLVGIMPASAEWENTGESDIIDGMNYIYTYAASVGEPAVINLSWGASLGPHDGNSLFSQACDNLTGAGKIFVCAAGNNGGDTIHLQHTFTPTDTVINTFATFSPYLSSKQTWVDMWGDTGKSFCLNVALYNGSTEGDSTGYVCLDNNVHDLYLIGSNSDTCFVTVTTSDTEFNGKPRILLTLYSRVPDNICLRVKSTDGTVHLWEGYVVPPEGYYGYLVSLGYPWALNGNTDYTVSDIGCTRSAITAGAFNSKVSFTNISSQPLYYPGFTRGHLASFSSHGPTQDGRIKPDITAPGMALASSINSYDTSYLASGTNYSSVISQYTSTQNGRTYSYAMLAGTSMASPCTAGIVALMLEANPTLTPAQTTDMLAETAIQDNFTGALPPQGTDLWGHGKINAYQCIFRALSAGGPGNINGLANCVLYPNPNNGIFTIKYLDTKSDMLSINVYDVSGKIVYSYNWPVSNNINTTQLNLSLLAKGIYFTKVSSSENEYSIFKTVIQ